MESGDAFQQFYQFLNLDSCLASLLAPTINRLTEFLPAGENCYPSTPTREPASRGILTLCPSGTESFPVFVILKNHHPVIPTGHQVVNRS